MTYCEILEDIDSDKTESDNKSHKLYISYTVDPLSSSVSAV